MAKDTLRALLVMRDTHAGSGTEGHPDGATAPLLCKLFLDAGFDVELSNNLERIRNPDSNEGLPSFDLVVFHGKLAVRDQEALDAIKSFVYASGKGLVVIHLATASFASFDETMEDWIQLIGPAWVSARPGSPAISHHPKPAQALLVTIEDVDHPIVADLPTSFTLERDELYQGLRGPQDGDIGRIIAIGTDTREENGVVMSLTEPVAYALSRGAGRVFNLSLGHTVSTHKDKNFQTLLRQGAFWAAGRH